MDHQETAAKARVGRLVVLAFVGLVCGLLSLVGLVVALRSGSIWGLLLLPFLLALSFVLGAIAVSTMGSRTRRVNALAKQA